MSGIRHSELNAVIRVYRPQQWTKNLLIFVPVILARRIDDVHAVTQAILGFVAFSACASAMYVLNDALDIDADRDHPIKSERPFASGRLRMQWSRPLIAAPLLLAFSISTTLESAFTGVLAVYLCIAAAYVLWLKTKVLIDVYTLAGLYTLRIFAGGVATSVQVSDWLFVFSMFIFTSLAFAKRYAELGRLLSESRSVSIGRGYVTTDIDLIGTIGQSCGCVSVLVLALYIHSPDVGLVYTRPWLLWAVCPIILYWITRVWLEAQRHTLSEDPLVFALKDWMSLICAVAVGLLLWFA